MNPGIYSDLPRGEYEKIPAANYSLLKHFELSPAHARERSLHPGEPTPAMEMGTAVHSAVLEPEDFAKRYIQAPVYDRRTASGKAAWKAFEADHPGRNYLSVEEWATCQGILASIESNETARLLLRGNGKNEISIVWTDEETGVLCKGRIDRFTSLYGWSVVVDLKTAQSAHGTTFMSQAARMSYHVQAAMYTDGLRAIAPADRRYIILAVEKDRPYGVNAFEYDDNALSAGRARYRRYLATYKKCTETGVWPGYDSGITPLSIPNWAI